MKRLLAEIPWSFLIVFTVVLMLLPLRPEPHLVQQFRWILEGQSFRPIDILDVFYHLAGVFVIILKLVFPPEGGASGSADSSNGQRKSETRARGKQRR